MLNTYSKQTSLLLFLICLLWSCSTDTPVKEQVTEKTITVSTKTPTITPTNATKDNSLSLPDSFNAYIMAEETGRARQMAVRENGDIYVQLSKNKKGKGMVALRDTDGDVDFKNHP